MLYCKCYTVCLCYTVNVILSVFYTVNVIRCMCATINIILSVCVILCVGYTVNVILCKDLELKSKHLKMATGHYVCKRCSCNVYSVETDQGEITQNLMDFVFLAA